ncbi:uncharacterized protein [Prorops nasuta]|uniref:uncharacterized protein isoform X2 n=1 Tax=Prorops nasuta TaxID=863751 RepID=UPI0034CDB3E0
MAGYSFSFCITRNILFNGSRLFSMRTFRHWTTFWLLPGFHPTITIQGASRKISRRTETQQPFSKKTKQKRELLNEIWNPRRKRVRFVGRSRSGKARVSQMAAAAHQEKNEKLMNTLVIPVWRCQEIINLASSFSRCFSFTLMQHARCKY